MNAHSVFSLSAPNSSDPAGTPALFTNPLLAAVQVLMWLSFSPRSWRRYVAAIRPSLRPEFCLAELCSNHLRSSALRRLMIAIYGVYPLLVGALTGLVLWAAGEPIEESLSDVGASIGVCLGISLGIGAAGPVVAGIVSGIVLGLAMGVAREVLFGLVLALMVTIGVGTASALTSHVADGDPSQSISREIGGVMISILLLGVAAALAILLLGNVPVGVVGCVAFGLATGWRTRSWKRGIVIGLLVGVGGGLALDAVTIVSPGVVSGLALGLGGGLLGAVLFVVPYALAERIAGTKAGAIAGAAGLGGLGGVGFLASVTAFTISLDWIVPLATLLLIGTLLGLTITWWMPMLLYPFQASWNFLIYRFEEQRSPRRSSLWRYHSAYWDEFQYLRLPGLDAYLVLLMERRPTEGQVAMERVSSGHQRWAAQAAQIEIDARYLARCETVEEIAAAHRSIGAGDLTGPASALLRSFHRISRDVAAALQQTSSYHRRWTLSGLEDRLDGLLRELTRSDEPYAVRFRPIAAHWRQVIARRVADLASAVESRQEIDNPYVIGVPLTERQEIFVGRTDISLRIEQLLLDRRRPPLLLYGQRRMGKTSLLTNLGRLLPTTIVPLFVDLQGPVTQASDHVGFLYNLGRGMIRSAASQRDIALPPLSHETLADDPFTRFDEWLDRVEAVLGEAASVLLALDEFEVLDEALHTGRFDERLILGMLRHLIQHRLRFKILLSGSHTPDELRHWASYLVNVQVIHIGYLQEEEARQLIERPVEGFALRYEPEATQRVLALTRRHPALVQLLCSEIVALKNEQPAAVRRLARVTDVEAALPEALSHGSFFFTDIEQNQVDGDGLALLRFIARQGEGAVVPRDLLIRSLSEMGLTPPQLEASIAAVMKRELLEEAGAGLRFQVELIRRWFAR